MNNFYDNTLLFCLHYPKLEYRKASLIQDLIDVNFPLKPIWIEGHNPEESIKRSDISFTITSRELSLSLKHFEVLNFLKNCSKNITYAIILEDDINIKAVPNFNQYIAQCLQELTDTNGDLCWIGGTPDLIPSGNITSENLLYYQYLDRCTHGYIINKKCTSALIEKYHYDLPVDHLYKQLIPLCDLKSAWAMPYLTQKTIEGTWTSSIRNFK